MGPRVDDFVVSLPVGDVPLGVRLLEPCDLLAGLTENLQFLLGHLEVRNAHADPTHRRVPEAKVLEVVQEFGRSGQPDIREAVENKVAQFLLSEGLIEEPHLLGDDGVEEHAAPRAA